MILKLKIAMSGFYKEKLYNTEKSESLSISIEQKLLFFSYGGATVQLVTIDKNRVHFSVKDSDGDGPSKTYDFTKTSKVTCPTSHGPITLERLRE